ncbi:O-acyltransferase like protein-like isoform X2 [Thrips palmi]|uniref:O-acyltransferase like protein-like isoform X2 n=1 Tax=Thrips palmi TaxID=161013 RepID=A0A6P8ZXI5_THRPL|nr:O-acyltransferase like protein-like isoform X2 [Thrips palmi]
MNAASAAFYLLLAVVLKSLREHGGRIRPAHGRGEGAIVAMLVVEASVLVDGALYPRLTPTAGLLLPPDTECHEHTLRLQRAFKNRTLWAARMVDASAGSVVGGLWGAHFQLGSFDGCLSAGTSSPVGARYCLARLFAADAPQVPGFHPRRQHPHQHYRPCEAGPQQRWDHVTGLDPESDARDALQGCGLVDGSIPLADVLVALCVPESCGAVPLQAALKKSLLRASASDIAFDVRVEEEYCVSHRELQDGQFGLAALFFWTLVLALSAAAVTAPYLGGRLSAWDWRTHVAALARPDAPLSGMDLSALSGVRGVNMVLLLGAHRAFNSAKLATTNQFINTAESRTAPLHALGHHASLLVDTCFFMSGLLMSLSPSVRQGTQDNHNALRATASRYLRLTLPYAMVMLFYAFAMESLGSGPLWKSITMPEAAACRRWWWANLLYVNNYVHGQPGEYACMLQSWSLAVDMQQFVLGTVLVPLLTPASNSANSLPRWSACILAVALLPPFVATLVEGWPPLLVWSARALQNPFAEPMFYSMYVATQFRAAPYVVGVLAGCVMLRFKERSLELNLWDSTRLTWGSLAAMLTLLTSSVLFADLSAPAPPSLVSALYAALCPFAWAAALAVFVVAVTFGQRTAVVGLLRWQPLVTLSRLSYGVYLVHFAVQLLQGGAERAPRNVTVATVFRDGFSDLVIALIVSAWLHLIVEAPVRYLAKSALYGRRLVINVKLCRKRTASEMTASSASPTPTPTPAVLNGIGSIGSAAKVSCF